MATDRNCVLLLATASSYRISTFNDVAESLDVDLVIGINMPKKLAELYQVPLALDFTDIEGSVEEILAFAEQKPLDAVLSVDDSASLLAAHANAALGLSHNEPQAALAARNKYVMRQQLAAGGIPVPWFQRLDRDVVLADVAPTLEYPLVVKPLLLSGSRGVIRANNPEEFVTAGERLRALLQRIGDTGDGQAILVEGYLPGGEIALEGLLTEGQLEVLALFDKPDPLEGPFFEETIYVTPSRLPEDLQEAIVQRTREAASALGLNTGPVHAELRYNEQDVWLIEMAGRSIGGLCGSILEFGTDACLEEVIIRQAARLPLPPLAQASDAAGVMMIPIPKRGVLRKVQGLEAAGAVPGITGIEITAPLDYPLTPLPEGESYLGFIFARADSPEAVEMALRRAHKELSFYIEDEIPVLPT